MATRYYILILTVASTALMIITPKAYWFLGYGSVLALIGSALAFGSVSALVAARGLYFLAHVTPHSALLAVPTAFLVSLWLGGGQGLIAALVTLALLLAAGYAIGRGVGGDVAASLLASFTASSSAIVLYEAQKRLGAASVSSLILGDPLLVGLSEGAIGLALGLTVFLISLSIAREVFYIGLSRELAAVDGLKVEVYDYTLYTLIALTTVVMLGIVGFLVASVLILLPGAIASLFSRGSIETLLASIAVALAASALGLIGGLALNITPSGVIGFTLVVLYASLKVFRVG
ncbi:MAG: metal ABC transporter permease [Thermoprotei archaeon]|nr:metal ABC transporter permease [Thermoprotei archaeon]